MNLQKKVTRVIDQFPSLLFQMNIGNPQQDVDLILDASGYSKPLALITITNPDMLFLNVNLQRKSAIDMVAADIHNCNTTKIGMITCNLHAYYINLCSTLDCGYIIDKTIDTELIPVEIARQQLN